MTFLILESVWLASPAPAGGKDLMRFVTEKSLAEEQRSRGAEERRRRPGVN